MPHISPGRRQHELAGANQSHGHSGGGQLLGQPGVGVGNRV